MVEQTLSSEQIYSGKALKLRVDTVETSSGKTATREIVEHSDCVAIVALDGKDNVILVKQFRGAAGKTLLEIPAGCIEPGEQPIECVRRELQEEIGYLPKKIDNERIDKKRIKIKPYLTSFLFAILTFPSFDIIIPGIMFYTLYNE